MHLFTWFRVRFGLVVMLAALGGGCSDSDTREPAEMAENQRAFIGGTVIPSPSAAAIEDGIVLVEGDRIIEVGSRATVRIPRGAMRVDCTGMTVLAGFWNSHVHFMAPEWEGAAAADAATLQGSLQAMLTRWGFVHVVDIGSDLGNTLAMRKRIDEGELSGPAILSAGPPFVTQGGQPRYVPVKLPELTSPEQAAATIASILAAGADVVKLMTASVVEDPPPPVMPHEVVLAATRVAHEHGTLVFAHPTTAEGVWAAVDGGVDILAHTAPDMGLWTDEDVDRIVRAGVSLTPTLSLFRYEMEKDDETEASIVEIESVAIDQLRRFRAAGGLTLFGTDVGYTTAFDPAREFQLLERAGLDFRAILSALTTAPVDRFHGGDGVGRLVRGADADLVILEGDPRRDVGAWTRVKTTIRAGRVLFEREP